MKQYKQLFRFARPHLKILFLAALSMVFGTVFDGARLSAIVPFCDRVLTNKKIIFSHRLPPLLDKFIQALNSIEPIKLLYIIIISVPLLILVRGIFEYLQGYYMNSVSQRVVRDVRNKIYEKLQLLSLDYYTQKRTGELVSRITYDVRMIENAVSYGLTDLIFQSLQIAMFIFLIFFIHPVMALISLVMVPAIGIPMANVGRVLRKLSKRTQEKMADINSLLYETISGARIVKAFSMEKYELERSTLQNRDFYKLTMKAVKRMLLLSPLTDFVGALAAVIILSYGGKLVINGKLSFGVFGFFLGALLSLIRPFKKLTQTVGIIQQAVAASDRIYDILDAPLTIKDKPGVVELPDIKNNIHFDHVYFKYEEQDVLKDINFEVVASEVVAIVGPSGSGKTTLMDLLCRFYDPQKGSVLIDGTDLKDVTLKSLRGQIGIVSQETILFNDTVMANIAYGNKEADIRQIREAAGKANAADFIENLPQGYNALIGDRGTKLSGGERQRMAIARAILKNPPILILDEATSQLDTASEKLVQEALDKLMVGRTVFIIAHRLSTIRNAHRIFVLDRGSLIEAGTHKELMDKDGVYKRLYDLQVLGIED